MDNELPLDSPKAPEPSNDFDLGTWLGMRRAFGMMAGKASAADAECLRRIRDDKLYLGKAATWPEFCAQYLGASRTSVNRFIHYLEEFGPDYFHLTQFTRITPEMYRVIAPQMKPEGIEFDGEIIPLTPQNAHRVTAAVSELRRRAEPLERAEPTREDAYLALERCVNDLVTRVEALPRRLSAEMELALASHMQRLRESVARVGVVL
ncbi:MAG: hypothetical protein C5B51_07040 [Terriglobia bacterium]|nr:MAG: hypothetical protein C5B51_07040 [Terriglobia bacterium]